MNKIKVAHIITKLELGGAQENTLYTCEHLDKSKFDVILISGCGGLLDERVKNIKTYFVRELIREICPLWDFIALIKIYRILKKEKPDIVHTHSSKAGILGRWATWFYNLRFKILDSRLSKTNSQLIKHRSKIIHTFHGFGFNNYQKSIVRFLFVLSEKITARITDVLIFVSESNLNEAKQKKLGDSSNYLLIRSGIDIDFFKNAIVSREQKKQELGIKSDEKVISTIGPFKKQKNLSDFLRVASLVKSGGVRAKFLIVGDGKERKRLLALTRNLSLQDDVIFLGWLKDKNQIAQILKISDVFAMTSLWEGLPRAVLEAMACGVPVCANSVDGLNDVIKHGQTGFLSQPFDTRQMASNILTILADESLRTKLTENAAKILNKNFEINYMVRQQEQLYLQKTGNLER